MGFDVLRLTTSQVRVANKKTWIFYFLFFNISYLLIPSKSINFNPLFVDYGLNFSVSFKMEV